MESETIKKSVQRVRYGLSGPPKGVIHFLNEQLRPSADFSIEKEFPSLFGTFPGGESLVLKVGDRVVSHVGYLIRDFNHADYRIRVGIIGSVATASDFQKRGLASTLLNRCLDDLKARGCTVAVLWSQSPEFYKKFNFFRVGQEVDMCFSSEEVPDIETPSVLMDRKKHGIEIWRLYRKHRCKIDRSLEEQYELFEIPKAKIYVTEKNGGVSSYIAINKGADFKDYIHEWGGEPTEVQKNIAWVQKNVYAEKSLTLISPASYDLSAFRVLSPTECSGVLGWMRVLDQKVLVETYEGFLKKREIPFRQEAATRSIVVGEQSYPFETNEEVLKVAFGQGEWKGPQPLPFFLWGFDSI